jgi:DNA segregation ATPase FtsK/SpoIIIE-like protein
LIIGGASNFGKSFALKSLITSVMWCCSPDDTEILIIDSGANSLRPFKDICAYVGNAEEGLDIILFLKEMMNHRKMLEEENPEEFRNSKTA